MPETFSKEERSEIMRRVRGRDTSLELRLRKLLWAEGLRGYRLHRSSLPGKPDLAFGKDRVAVFVDGCFWHGCPECYRRPKNNAEYWSAKLERNQTRDRLVSKELRSLGWAVIRIWEHEVRRDPDGCVKRVAAAVHAASSPSP